MVRGPRTARCAGPSTFPVGVASSTGMQGLPDHRFTSLPVRFVRIRWKTWDANCGDEFGSETARGCGASGTTSELQVFGLGAPVQVDLRSPILDLQRQKNINALRWGGQVPGGYAYRAEAAARAIRSTLR